MQDNLGIENRNRGAVAELPFVRHDTHGRLIKAWEVPEMSDYEAGCALGCEYARQLADYFRVNRNLAGGPLLMWIVSDIDYGDDNRRSVVIGFLSGIGQLLATTHNH